MNMVTVEVGCTPRAVMPSLWVVNPPVETVLQAVQKASTSPTPCTMSSPHRVAVRSP